MLNPFLFPLSWTIKLQSLEYHWAFLYCVANCFPVTRDMKLPRHVLYPFQEVFRNDVMITLCCPIMTFGELVAIAIEEWYSLFERLVK